jgi:hypothetical protein
MILSTALKNTFARQKKDDQKYLGICANGLKLDPSGKPLPVHGKRL